jgi:hypothetical protein
VLGIGPVWGVGLRYVGGLRNVYRPNAFPDCPATIATLQRHTTYAFVRAAP